MNPNTRGCMGGWCALRDRCIHYHVTSMRRPSERLCMPGQDGRSAVVSVQLLKPVGSWERDRVPQKVAA